MYDFLLQVALFQRSENTSDEQMLLSIMHLLEGRAKYWYQSVYDELHTWEEFVAAIKSEFLPENYDYVLLSEITNRSQKPNESFGEYITHMQGLFKCLSINVSEDHKLFLVQKNLLPRYALGIVALEIRSLQELSNVCRKIDNACNKNSLRLPFQQDGAYNQRTSNFRVNAVEHASDSIEPNIDFDLCAVRRISDIGAVGGINNDSRVEQQNYDRPVNPFSVRPQTPVQQNGYRQPATNPQLCWNCEKPGHRFNDCLLKRNGIMCYKCGLKGTIVKFCPRCTKNDQGGLGNAGDFQGRNLAPLQ